ncbi:hypothetical protein NC653_005009 [Populus alba x Populus x berolinensis]|uniref:Uncharacterized protein n=1 Tax=Populus alba x Populus x berolinensis TaxID=444605 RepID=A0AAD6WAJ5_9ROSI|nr:hypothetical protein NC653_005009 [Populus alba x Populus x berolinensis]
MEYVLTYGGPSLYAFVGISIPLAVVCDSCQCTIVIRFLGVGPSLVQCKS